MMDATAFAEETKKRLQSCCPDSVNLDKLAGLLHTRVSTLDDVIEMSRFACVRLPMNSDMYVNKKNKTTVELCRNILAAVRPILATCEDWNNTALFELLKAYGAEAGLKAGAIMWAVRIAVARQSVTPGGATELMEVFGKQETLERIDLALAELVE